MIQDHFATLEGITKLVCAIDNDLRGEIVDPATISRATDNDAMDISSARFNISADEYNPQVTERLCFTCGNEDIQPVGVRIVMGERGRGVLWERGRLLSLRRRLLHYRWE